MQQSEEGEKKARYETVCDFSWWGYSSDATTPEQRLEEQLEENIVVQQDLQVLKKEKQLTQFTTEELRCLAKCEVERKSNLSIDHAFIYPRYKKHVDEVKAGRLTLYEYLNAPCDIFTGKKFPGSDLVCNRDTHFECITADEVRNKKFSEAKSRLESIRTNTMLISVPLTLIIGLGLASAKQDSWPLLLIGLMTVIAGTAIAGVVSALQIYANFNKEKIMDFVYVVNRLFEVYGYRFLDVYGYIKKHKKAPFIKKYVLGDMEIGEEFEEGGVSNA